MDDKKITAIGHGYEDVHYSGDGYDFINKYKNFLGSMKVDPIEILNGRKITVDDSYRDLFFELIDEIKFQNDFDACLHGGGYYHSMTAFHSLDYQINCFDSCKYNGSTKGFPNAEFFSADFCSPCTAIVIDTNGITANLKISRGDIGRKLSNFSKKYLYDILNSGTDVLVNSASNEDIAYKIIKSSFKLDKGWVLGRNLCTLVTKHFDKNGEALNDLMTNSSLVDFSLAEFYWLVSNSEKLKKLTDGRINDDKARDIFSDLKNFLIDRSIRSSVIATMGRDGAIYASNNRGNVKGAWIYLNHGMNDVLQAYIKENRITTNSAGDKFIAFVIDGLKKNKNLEDAIIHGSVLTIQEVLKFNHNRINEESYAVAEFT